MRQVRINPYRYVIVAMYTDGVLESTVKHIKASSSGTFVAMFNVNIPKATHAGTDVGR
jgi:hypothetical protein